MGATAFICMKTHGAWGARNRLGIGWVGSLMLCAGFSAGHNADMILDGTKPLKRVVRAQNIYRESISVVPVCLR